MGLLEGKVAVLLGAGPGLGGAIALRLAAEGADLILAARGNRPMAELADEASRFGGKVLTQRTDITVPGDVDRLAEVAEQHRGRVDALVVNAFTAGPTVDVAQADLNQWREVMEVNLWGPLASVQRLLPLLREPRSASVVMISAMTTRMVSSRGRAGYAMSKAALNQAVRSLAFELGADGIRVNAVLPGWLAGATTRAWMADPDRRDQVDRALAAIPLGSFPTTEDVAGTIVYLASELSLSVTGALLDANGGQYMNT